MNHADLVARAARWLHYSQKHSVVLVEIGSTSERPDVIGWRGGFSSLVECKASRADFLADRKKVFRAHPETGMGEHRWYCAPPGIVSVDDLPEGWGLVEPFARSMRVARKPAKIFGLGLAHHRDQQRLLQSALERVAGGWGRGQIAYPVVGPSGPPPAVCTPCGHDGLGRPGSPPRCAGCGKELRGQIGAGDAAAEATGEVTL